jgi:ribosome modulation factor
VQYSAEEEAAWIGGWRDFYADAAAVVTNFSLDRFR